MIVKLKQAAILFAGIVRKKELQKQIPSYISNRVSTPQFDTGFPPFMTIHPWCECDKPLEHNVKLGHYYMKTMQSAMLKNDL